jgi:hypothetical protein
LKQTRVALIAAGWGAIAAMFRLATRLLVADHRQHRTQPLDLGNRPLVDLPTCRSLSKVRQASSTPR